MIPSGLLPCSVLLPKLFGKDFLGPFCLKKSFPKIRTTKPKILGNNPKGIIKEDLGYVSQIFPPKDDGEQSHALLLDIRDCALSSSYFSCQCGGS